MKYYIDINNNYIGAFSEGNPAIPQEAIEVDSPPADARQKWNGLGYDEVQVFLLDEEPVIYLYVDVHIKDKNHKSINYKNELDNGYAFHPVETFIANGLINDVTYYAGYVDINNKGTEVLKVSHTWEVDELEPVPSARSVKNRTKTWEWKNNGGQYNTEKKVKYKIYDTQNKKNKEGERRRNNLLNHTQQSVVTILLLTGQAADESTAVDMLIGLFDEYEKSFATYIKTGKGSIYTSLANDNDFSWMQTIIGSTASTYLGLDVSYSTKDIKEYSIDKLKGLI